jgi:hypothetical protein
VTTEKQIAANRLNALKGGVKTETGKAAVRLNAVSHGLLSKEVLLPGEDGCRLAALRRQYLAELQPEGELETLLVDRIVSSSWRLRRALRIEKTDTPDGGNYRFGNWHIYMRYETALEHQIYKALHELQSLQAYRLAKRAAEAQADCAEGSSSEEKATMAMANLLFKNAGLVDDQS